MKSGKKKKYPKYRKSKVDLLARTSKVMNDLRGLFPELNLDENTIIPILARCRRNYEKNLHYGRRGVPANRRRIRKLTATEQIVYDRFGEMLDSGDYGDFTRQDIVKARRKLEVSITEQQKAISELEDSIFWLERVLSFLGD